MSTRAITSIWYFFCLIMISSYTANLAAFLTVEKLVSPIENVEDLANQKSTMGTYKRIYQFMEKHADEVYVNSNHEGIEKVKKGGYAYFMEATSIEYNTERECNLTQIGGLLDNKGYGIAVKKARRHNLRAWLSGGILKLQEQGQMHTFKERWWKQKKGGGSCSQTSKSSGSVNELGLGNVGGVFVVMLLGIVLSALMGVIEFLWFQRKLKKESEMSLFKLLMREIKHAITCGSSSKPAPKLKSQKDAEEPTKALAGYNSLY
ncbi:glutamate receptor ionotropic, kainate 2 [Caerostris extrusa]|uniref:Glutamate receptor ionotropic, kainate 2 n=1 Tax=Caerostris extrusa TaxID=172846 RepID=A0AAV4XIS8_CAEEX|nr:glutamate receptor ionotropic, kainate 2 [Caerostris extrusa]